MAAKGMGGMIARFTGDDERRRLIHALQAQRIIGNDATVATAVAEHLQLRELAVGDVLIRQGEADDDLFLVVSGRLVVEVNGRIAAYRESGTHVGEIALLDPTARRTATVSAVVPTLVGVVSEPSFSKVANAHPVLWRALAIELGSRLDQRGRFFKPPNEVPVVFIGSAKETLGIAEAVQDALSQAGIDAVVWSQGVFGASHFPIEDLERELQRSDFAVLVAGADDQVISRGSSAGAPRDNVVFELGLFMGR
jgi:CRP/FNR family cyclic AMP-dependent transcriptional regulator